MNQIFNIQTGSVETGLTRTAIAAVHQQLVEAGPVLVEGAEGEELSEEETRGKS